MLTRLKKGFQKVTFLETAGTKQINTISSWHNLNFPDFFLKSAMTHMQVKNSAVEHLSILKTTI